MLACVRACVCVCVCLLHSDRSWVLHTCAFARSDLPFGTVLGGFPTSIPTPTPPPPPPPAAEDRDAEIRRRKLRASKSVSPLAPSPSFPCPEVGGGFVGDRESLQKHCRVRLNARQWEREKQAWTMACTVVRRSAYQRSNPYGHHNVVNHHHHDHHLTSLMLSADSSPLQAPPPSQTARQSRQLPPQQAHPNAHTTPQGGGVPDE